MNFGNLPRTEKDALKPTVGEIKKLLEGDDNQLDILREGVTVNYGKRQEPRHTVRIQILD